MRNRKSKSKYEIRSFLILFAVIIMFVPFKKLSAFDQFDLLNADNIPQEIIENKNTNKNFFTAAIMPQDFVINPTGNLSVKIVYMNNGNVEIAPEVKIDIVKYGGEIIKKESYPYPVNEKAVMPQEKKEIAISLDVNGLKKGKYVAKVTILLGEEERHKDEFAFIIGEPKYNTSSYNYNIDWPLIVFIAMIVGTVSMVFNGKSKTLKK